MSALVVDLHRIRRAAQLAGIAGEPRQAAIDRTLHKIALEARDARRFVDALANTLANRQHHPIGLCPINFEGSPR